jgi:LAO/AO transport system kinase
MHELELASRLKAGDRLALAKAISIVENRKRHYRDLIEAIYPIEKKALKIGITGSPGSGKSTLVSQLIEVLKQKGLQIGVLAVDPSSPISGGALLGDRIRMIQHSTAPNVFMRSLASRGYLGGLSASTVEIIDILEAAGMDIILIETVGVGQSEIDIVNAADIVTMVLTPTSGDEIQIFKAGIIEIADIFVVNKADLGGAEIKTAEIANYFAMSQAEPVIAVTAARSGAGVAELAERMLRMPATHAEAIAAKKRSVRRQFVLKIFQERLFDAVDASPACQTLLAQAESGNPFHSADAIYRTLLTGGLDDKKN